MLLNPDLILRGISGEVLIRVEATPAVGDTPAVPAIPWTLGDVIIDALMGGRDSAGTGLEKFTRGKLAELVYSASESNPVSITPEEAASIKEAVGVYPTVLMLPVWDILDGSGVIPQDDDEPEEVVQMEEPAQQYFKSAEEKNAST